jgi:hypothetical protein
LIPGTDVTTKAEINVTTINLLRFWREDLGDLCFMDAGSLVWFSLILNEK